MYTGLVSFSPVGGTVQHSHTCFTLTHSSNFMKETRYSRIVSPVPYFLNMPTKASSGQVIGSS